MLLKISRLSGLPWFAASADDNCWRVTCEWSPIVSWHIAEGRRNVRFTNIHEGNEDRYNFIFEILEALHMIISGKYVQY